MEVLAVSYQIDPVEKIMTHEHVSDRSTCTSIIWCYNALVGCFMKCLTMQCSLEQTAYIYILYAEMLAEMLADMEYM